MKRLAEARWETAHQVSPNVVLCRARDREAPGTGSHWEPFPTEILSMRDFTTFPDDYMDP